MTGPVTRREPRTITLDGHTYAIDLADYEFGPQDTFRDGVTAGDQPSDALFNARGAWARNHVAWHHGSDQEIADFVEEADPYRFDKSFGFDTWSRLGLELLPEPTEETSVTIASGNPLLQRAGSRLYLAEGDKVWYTADPLHPDNFWTAGTTPDAGETIYSLATDGTTLYVAFQDGVKKYLSGAPGTPVAFSTPITGATQKVAFAANRLLIGQGNVLYEVAAAGTLADVITHFQPDFRWTTVFAIGSRIYAGGFVGVKSELYTLTVDSTGALVQGQEAASIPLGEELLCGVSTGSSCLIGTSAGVRFAQSGGEGTLTYGPLIDKVGRVTSIVVEGRYAYVTWNDAFTHLATQIGGVGSGTAIGVARLDLATFVDVLQPAYAADVHVKNSSLDMVTGIERYDEATVFSTDSDALFWAHDNAIVGASVLNAPTAKLTSGEIFFGTIEPKGLIELEVRFDTLLDTQEVSATVTDFDSETVIGTGTADTVGQTVLTVPLGGTLVRSAGVTIEAANPSQYEGMRIHAWGLRAYPAPPQVLQWQCPIILHDNTVVGAGQGEQRGQRPDVVLARFVALHASRATVVLVSPEGTFDVRVESFKVQARKWAADDMAHQGLLYLQLVSAG